MFISPIKYSIVTYSVTATHLRKLMLLSNEQNRRWPSRMTLQFTYLLVVMTVVTRVTGELAFVPVLLFMRTQPLLIFRYEQAATTFQLSVLTGLHFWNLIAYDLPHIYNYNTNTHFIGDCFFFRFSLSIAFPCSGLQRKIKHLYLKAMMTISK